MKKKKIVSLLALLIMAVTGARAQGTQTLTVYDGTEVSNSLPALVQYFNEDLTGSQIVIPATDLDAMWGGTITAMKFYTSSSSSYTTTCNVDVFLKEVNYTEIYSYEAKSDVAYHGTLSFVAEGGGGSLTITLTTPYTYKGGNLLIGIENTEKGTGGQEAISFYGQAVQGASISGFFVDNEFSMTYQNFIPKTTFFYTANTLACEKPQLVVSNVYDEGATLTCSGGSGTYHVQYKLSVAPDWIDVATKSTETTFTLTGLFSSEVYNVRAQSICGSENTSAWQNVNFTTTEYGNIGDNWSDGFEGANTSWEFTNGSCTNAWVRGTAVNNGGEKALYISNDGGANNTYTNTSASMVYACRYIKFTNGKYLFSYDWRTDGQTSYDYLRVALVPKSVNLTAGSVPEGFSESALPSGWIALDGGSALYHVTEWQSKQAVVNNLSGEYYMVFAWRNNENYGTNPPAAIDNVSVTHIICSADVEGLAASDVTANSATVSWTVGEGTQWQVAYSTNSSFEGATEVIVSSASYEMTNLKPSTRYYVRVRAYCGGTDYGLWSSVNFTTSSAAGVVAVDNYWSDDFEGESCGWNLINGSLTNAWAWGTAVNKGGEKALYISNDGSTINAYTNNSETMVYAIKRFTFTDGKYEFSYDWQAKGEAGSDYLRVALVPVSETLTAGSVPEGFSASALPSGWIALDGGNRLCLADTWQSKLLIHNFTEAGDYYLVFAWKNDHSLGSNPPAAIDNVSIRKITCPAEAGGLAVSNITSTSATISWTEVEDTQWQVVYSTNSTFEGATEAIVSSASYNMTNLTPETPYYVRVRSYCGGTSYGVWSDAKSFTPTDDFILYAGSETSRYVPIFIQGYANSQQNQMIYPATELTALVGKSITEMKFYISSVEINPPGEGDGGNWTVSIGETDATTLSSLDSTTPITQVYSGTLTFNSDDTEMTVTFEDEGYLYHGGNLLVEFKNPSAAKLQKNYKFVGETVTGASYSNGSQYNFLPKTFFKFGEPPACPKPTNLTSSEITSTAATLSWRENGTATAWEICLNDDEENLISADSNPFTLTGLTPEATYTAKVRAVSGSDYSRWSNAISFKPTDDFIVHAGNATNEYVPFYGYYADQFQQNQMIYPATELTALVGKSITEMKFYISSVSGTGNIGNWIVSLGETDATTLSGRDTTTPLTQVYSGAMTFNADNTEMTITFEDDGYTYHGGNLLVEFNHPVKAGYKHYFFYGETVTGASYTYGSQRNFLPKTAFTFGEPPACAKPTNLTGSEITSTAATLSWTENGTATAWEICLNGDEENLISADSNPFTVTGLTPETAYAAKVRAVRGSDYGRWSNVANFTTLDAILRPSDLTSSEITPIAATLSWTENDTATEWEICLNGDEENLISADSNPFTVTGLTPETAYTAKVRAVIGSGHSHWCNNVANFTTLVANPIPFNVAATTVKHNSAKVAWTGYSDSYVAKISKKIVTTSSYDFEGNEIPDNFTNSATYPWTIQSSDHSGSSYCAIPGNKGVKSSTSDLTCVVSGPGSVSFWAKVSSESGYDKGSFRIDNTEKMNISGTKDWTEYSYELTEGEHTLIWRYKKDSSGDKNDDLFYVDDITITTFTFDSWNEYAVTEESCTFSGLTANTLYGVQVKGVKEGYDDTEWSETVDFTTPDTPADITLAETVDNTDWLTTNDGVEYNVTLTRTLQTGGWNTFAVPFDLDTPTGWTVKELTSSDFANGTLTLNFGDATGIVAGTPYLVRVDAAVANPTFDGVIISKTAVPAETTYADFIPVFSPTNLTGGDESVLFVTGGDKLTYPTANGNINGFRAYFQLKGDAVSLARAFRMSFGDASGIEDIYDLQINDLRFASGTYTLDGRRINGQPTEKGVYIVNGKKTIIK